MNATGLAIGKPDTIPKPTVALSQAVVVAVIVWQVFVLARRVTSDATAAIWAALSREIHGWTRHEGNGRLVDLNGQSPCGRLLAVRRMLLTALLALVPVVLDAHGVASRDARFLEALDGPAIGPLLYLGAKHMVTGYDHLLFLVGVVFFLYRARDILLYVSLFTLGHSLTLLAGALGGVRANPYLIDAIIGLSIAYKAFENMGGFRRLGVSIDPRLAVLTFGLFHGLGLATKLQEFALSGNGLVTNILSFNVGVEIGQILALGSVLIALAYWRAHPGYLRHAFSTNALLMTAGFGFTVYQLAGFFIESS